MGLEVDDTNSIETYYAIIGRHEKKRRVELINTEETKRNIEALALCEPGEVIFGFEVERATIHNMSG